MIIFDIETIPDEEKIASRQWKEFKEKKKIESDQDAALYPAFGRVVCICAFDQTDGRKLKEAGEDELTIIERFVNFVDQSKGPKVLCGHYIKGFDIPFICVRILANRWIIPSWLNSAGKKPWEILHIDTAEILKIGGMNSISLDATCLMLGIESPKEGEVNALTVWAAYKAKDFSKIINYCCSDMRASIQLDGALSFSKVIK